MDWCGQLTSGFSNTIFTIESASIRVEFSEWCQLTSSFSSHRWCLGVKACPECNHPTFNEAHRDLDLLVTGLSPWREKNAPRVLEVIVFGPLESSAIRHPGLSMIFSRLRKALNRRHKREVHIRLDLLAGHR